MIWALQFIISVSAMDCNQKQSFSIVNTVYPFSLVSLPYNYDFLNVVLPTPIVMTHHNVNQLGYATKLNNYIASAPNYNSTTLTYLCLGAVGNVNLQQWAGGVYNHQLYWWTLTSPSCANPAPTGILLTQIINTWGSFSQFVSLFEYKSNNLFGNGWTWLCSNTTQGLEIRTSTFQTNPLMNYYGSICYPILGLDLWEHAYYWKYTYDRTSYISDFFDLIDWAIVEYFYEKFALNFSPVPL
jgi:superoxide dismutase, Fe-Mn family